MRISPNANIQLSEYPPRNLNSFYKGKRICAACTLPQKIAKNIEVVYDKNTFLLNPNSSCDITEDKLPAEGYFLDNSGKESIIVTIPTKDKGLFAELAKKFGWACM